MRGIQLQDPTSFTVTVSPSEGMTVEGDMVHFTQQGEYEITCSSESDAVSAYVQVVGEVLNPMVQATSIAFSEAEMALSDVAISNGAADEELIMAYLRLQMAKEMLPENLSNVLCSLQPQKRRRALCVEINFDKQGIIKDYKFDRGIIKSAARLTYNEVEGYMNNSSVPDDSFKESLQASFILFNQLLKQRTQRGALDFKIAEPTLKIDRDENVIDVIDRSRLTSHKLIEEFMLAANIVAADFLRKN